MSLQRFAVAVILSAVVAAGCAEGQSSGDNNNTNQNTGADDGQNDNDNSGVTGELTTEEAAAVESAARQTVTIGATSSAVSYARQTAQAGGKVSAQQFGSCPEVVGGIDADELQATVALDFGSGCMPDLYPGVSFSGSISGTVSASPFLLELSFNAFSIGSRTVDGEIELTYDKSEDSVAFSADLLLDTSDGEVLTLEQVTWVLDIGTGVLTISGTGSAEDADGNVYQIEVADVVSDGQGNGNFIPEEGTVTLTLPNDEAVFGPDSTVIVMTFTAQSPVDGTVLVSVNGAQSSEFQTALTTDGASE